MNELIEKTKQWFHDKGVGNSCMACLVALLLFISMGEALGAGCQADRSQMVALEVLPLWVYGLIVAGCPLIVLARLAWGASPWDLQSRIEKDKTTERKLTKKNYQVDTNQK